MRMASTAADYSDATVGIESMTPRNPADWTRPVEPVLEPILPR